MSAPMPGYLVAEQSPPSLLEDMLLFFLLGVAAGFMNVYRVATGIGQGVGYSREDGSDNSDGPAK